MGTFLDLFAPPWNFAHFVPLHSMAHPCMYGTSHRGRRHRRCYISRSLSVMLMSFVARKKREGDLNERNGGRPVSHNAFTTLSSQDIPPECLTASMSDIHLLPVIPDAQPGTIMVAPSSTLPAQLPL